jgi:hypothetical protein
MRVITYENVEYELSEDEWKLLIKRFNADEAIINAFGYYFIPAKSICFERDYKCISCPLRDPHKKTNSCTYLFRNIIGEDLFEKLHLFDSGIAWEPKFDKKVRLAFKEVMDQLSKSDRVDHR